MRLSILTITENGRKLGETLKTALMNDPTILSVKIIHGNIDFRDVFSRSDMIIGIMAAGIMVRKIAPLLKNKFSDPGVIVIDEMGQNVISLLSGHAGGANDFAVKIADILNANPVITTATDVNGLVGIDSFAARYFYLILDRHLVKHFNSSIVDGHTVELHSSRNLEPLIDGELSGTYRYIRDGDEVVRAHCNSEVMRLAPLKVSVGIGTRRGVESTLVTTAIVEALGLLKLPPERIDALATGYMKKNESGVIDAAENLGVPLEIIPPQELRSQDTHSFSDFVNEKFGVGSVCEAAALKSAGAKSKLVIRKTTSSGVAVAVAVSGTPKTF
ncbi:cobalt-precorrin 5A hydrolase [Methanothermobacter sp. K4]|uniref:cobalt-precorrin 5A hydrolase n=1 Tax=Methanothermobacter sp. K4 TaxID=2913262 RepID=UPI001EDBC0D9|nr:cobalt-precorrin 5A hydrolase [Methanothermobacter sp. K4]MCG2827951.1 cobalt-precorrin 5A hydrolase [Methanothermobacter sp. K4]